MEFVKILLLKIVGKPQFPVGYGLASPGYTHAHIKFKGAAFPIGPKDGFLKKPLNLAARDLIN